MGGRALSLLCLSVLTVCKVRVRMERKDVMLGIHRYILNLCSAFHVFSHLRIHCLLDGFNLLLPPSVCILYPSRICSVISVLLHLGTYDNYFIRIIIFYKLVFDIFQVKHIYSEQPLPVLRLQEKAN